MLAIIRSYSGAGSKEAFDVLEKRSSDVQSLMRSVKGLVSYTLARSASGGFSVTLCQDKAGIDESTQKAREWIAKNVPNVASIPPQVSEGSVILHVK